MTWSEGNPFYAEQLLAAGTGDAQVALPLDAGRCAAGVGPRGCLTRPSMCCGWRRWPAAGSPTGYSPRLPGGPRPTSSRACTRAVGAGVLVSIAQPEARAFRHALLQEAVYGDLLPGEQVRLHAAYARLLASEPEVAAANSPTTAWRAMTSSAAWPRRCGRPRRRRQSSPPPRRSATSPAR